MITNACARIYLTPQPELSMLCSVKDLFTKLESAAWGGLVSTQGRLFKKIEDDLRRKSGITHAEFEVLLRLVFAPSARLRIQELASMSALTHSGTSRLVDRLVGSGFVERAHAEEDGRGAYAVLTREGRAHFNIAARQHVALVRSVFLSHFSRKELEQMASFWERIDYGKLDTDVQETAKTRPGKKRSKRR